MELQGKTINILGDSITEAVGVSDNMPSAWSIKKEDAKPLENYVKVIEEIGKIHNIPVRSLYRNLGIDPNDKRQREIYTVDGLHFYDKGHFVLSECIAEFLKSL